VKLPEGYAALVTSGAAAAMQSGWPVSSLEIIRSSSSKFQTHRMKTEVIIQKSHRNPFDHQLRSTGVKLIVVEPPTT